MLYEPKCEAKRLTARQNICKKNPKPQSKQEAYSLFGRIWNGLYESKKYYIFKKTGVVT